LCTHNCNEACHWLTLIKGLYSCYGTLEIVGAITIIIISHSLQKLHSYLFITNQFYADKSNRKAISHVKNILFTGNLSQFMFILDVDANILMCTIDAGHQIKK